MAEASASASFARVDPARYHFRVDRLRRRVIGAPEKWSSPAQAGTEPGLQVRSRSLLYGKHTLPH